jgi:hypothetical protein
MSFDPVTRKWPEDRAVLFVHGIGNTQPGDLDGLMDLVKQALGGQAGRFAYYPLYYDQINDWFAQKTQLAGQIGKITALIKGRAGGDKLAEVAAEFGGDVIWPVLLKPAREAIRESYLLQLKQIQLDGIRAGVMAAKQKVTIICHSLGCFHTYETLHYAAIHPEHNLTPATDGFRLANVVYMASPVQLIRTVARELGLMVPEGLATMNPEGLYCPWESGLSSRKVFSVKNWVSIAGDLDPVAGFLFHKKLDWAYMKVFAQEGFSGQRSIIDRQTWLNIGTVEALQEALLAALDPKAPPQIKVNNPHSWEGYVQHHQEELKTWLCA